MKFGLALLLLASGAAASGQIVSETRTNASGAQSRVLVDRGYSSLSRPGLVQSPAEVRECLTEKATGAYVCHTRAEWKKIAARATVKS
jgi:hypothetical protein